MGTITTGIGLMSGIDTAALIDALITLESGSKNKLQNRIITLQSQQAAMIDINAKLLSFKNIAKSLKSQSIFQSAQATSSNESVFTAFATSQAQPGSFSFTIKQLAAFSQKLSKGFADANTTPVGLDFLSFNFGKGNIDRDRLLSELNGGQGVAAGKITITDKAGATATIDLTDVTTLGEAIDRINLNSQVAVQARIDGDRLAIDDLSGGAGTLSVASVGSASTAADLGIAGSTGGSSLTGSIINTLGASSSLASLNDGLGVLIQNNVPDLQITARDGTTHNIDLGQVNSPITADTLLSELAGGEGITLSSDNDNPDMKFVARDGTEYEVNLTGVTTVGGLISRIAQETYNEDADQSHIQLSIAPDGKRLIVSDTISGAGPLQVLGAGTNGTATANDLGILNEAGANDDSFTGSIIPNTISIPAATTIGQVIERITEQTGGKVIASIGDDGVSIKLTDSTGDTASNLIVKATAGNTNAAAALGLLTDELGVATDAINGQRLVAHLGSVLTRNLNGGAGLDGASSLTLTDRAGNSVMIAGLDAFDSLSQIIEHVNTEAAGAGVAITASLNPSGTGLLMTDTSGGGASNLKVEGDAAAALGIEADVATNSISGSNLSLKYIGVATKLSNLNYGKGIGQGSFKITDGFGKTATFNINANQKTLADVVQVINAQAGGASGLAIRARLNDTGTGLLIESDLSDQPPGATPFVALKVQSVSGTTAKDLGILGQSSSVEDAFIDGSYTRTIDLDPSDSLNKVAQKINAAGIPLTASVINSGSGANPYRLNFTSAVGGAMGEIIIDSGGVDLGLTTLSKAQDAKVFFGSPDSGGFLVTSQTNQIKNVLDGVTIDLHSVSADPVTVTVSKNTESITAALGQFVAAFNEVIKSIDQHDYYDLEKEERGVLLGNPTTSRVRTALIRAVRQQAENVDTQYQFLREVGISIGSGGELEFDEEKFTAAYESDPAAVENLFSALETVTQTEQEISPGITVQSSSTQSLMRGFGAIFDDLLDGLTNPVDGTLTRADQNFKDQIALVNTRIAAFEERLDAKRLRLERQFTAMEMALSSLQGQGNALASLASSVQMLSQMRR